MRTKTSFGVVPEEFNYFYIIYYYICGRRVYTLRRETIGIQSNATLLDNIIRPPTCSRPRRELDINRRPEYSGQIVCEIQYRDILIFNITLSVLRVLFIYIRIRFRAYDIIIIIMQTFHSRNRFTRAGQVQREPRRNDISKVDEIMWLASIHGLSETAAAAVAWLIYMI